MSCFVLEFNLTFPVLRKSKLPYRDERLKPDGSHLRASVDISFLRKQPEDFSVNNDETEYMYEAGISCVLSGWDHWAWAAYMFIDTYYDKVESRDSIQHYEDLWTGCRVDPLTAGDMTLDRAIQQPREYWLKVFSIRVSQAVEESDIVFGRVKQKIQTYVRSNPYTCLYQESRGTMWSLTAL